MITEKSELKKERKRKEKEKKKKRNLDLIEELLKLPTVLHIRIIQRNARKTITSIEGLADEIDHDIVLKALKKTLNCNGYQKKGIIYLQGDHRITVEKWLIKEGIGDWEHIIIHGF